MPLTYVARSISRAAELARRASKPLDGLRIWANVVPLGTHHNKAVCAVATMLLGVSIMVLSVSSVNAAFLP